MKRQGRRGLAWAMLGLLLLLGAAPVVAIELLGLPTRQLLPSVINGNPHGLALPPADEASQRLTVPAGFALRAFRTGLTGAPRFMAFGPDGALYVSLMSAGT